MKVGMRKPSVKRMVKARTTGKIKRQIKKSVNPLYGKKGMGYIKNPERALKQKVYHKTTVGLTDAVKSNKKKQNSSNKTNTTNNKNAKNSSTSTAGCIVLLIALSIALCLAFPLMWIPFGIIVLITIIVKITNSKKK